MRGVHAGRRWVWAAAVRPAHGPVEAGPPRPLRLPSRPGQRPPARHARLHVPGGHHPAAAGLSTAAGQQASHAETFRTLCRSRGCCPMRKLRQCNGGRCERPAGVGRAVGLTAALLHEPGHECGSLLAGGGGNASAGEEPPAGSGSASASPARRLSGGPVSRRGYRRPCRCWCCRRRSSMTEQWTSRAARTLAPSSQDRAPLSDSLREAPRVEVHPPGR